MKTARYKFGLCGTSSAGKTTYAYGLVSRLKTYSILAEGVFSQDRKFSFDKSLLDTSEIAQHWMVTNLVAKEVEMSLHGDTDVLVSDRTVVDFMAYYETQYPYSSMKNGLLEYTKEWVKTYTKIFYFAPLAYHDDGKRPGESFRDQVDSTLLRLIETVPEFKEKVVFLDKAQVLNTVLKEMNFNKPGAKLSLTYEDVQWAVNHLQVEVATKFSSNCDAVTDQDLYFLGNLTEEAQRKCKTFFRSAFGDHVLMDFYFIPDAERLLVNSKYEVVKPTFIQKSIL